VQAKAAIEGALVLLFHDEIGIELTGIFLRSNVGTFGDPTMIELAVFFAIVLAMGGAVVKFYEWRQGVLYGRYIASQPDAHRKRPLSDAE
jgi:hypothetical protein